MDAHSTKPPAGIVITSMHADHLDDLADLESMTFSTPWSYDALAEELQNPLAVFYVAEDVEAESAVGYLGMAEARAYARKNEMTRICLEVRASNAAARSLYEDFGFEEDGVRPGFYDSPKEDAVLYSLYI